MAAMTKDMTTSAASLYIGDVMHARLKPFVHRFNYRVMSLLIDLDRLEDANRQSILFGVNRRALHSFHERDHGRRDGSPLRAYAADCARAHGIDLTGGKVLLLCYPRLLGYAFNPLSVYFCFNATGELALMIYEVRNTFRQMHHYVLPVASDQRRAELIRQQQDKTFYVSPFIEADMRYHFRISRPADTVRIRILETDPDGPLLAATFFGRQSPLTSASLAKAFLALPFVTAKIIAAIHWQALRLWLKGAKLVPGAPAGTASLERQQASSSSALAH
jgi:hypothetical protein